MTLLSEIFFLHYINRLKMHTIWLDHSLNLLTTTYVYFCQRITCFTGSRFCRRMLQVTLVKCSPALFTLHRSYAAVGEILLHFPFSLIDINIQHCFAKKLFFVHLNLFIWKLSSQHNQVCLCSCHTITCSYVPLLRFLHSWIIVLTAVNYSLFFSSVFCLAKCQTLAAVLCPLWCTC